MNRRPFDTEGMRQVDESLWLEDATGRLFVWTEASGWMFAGKGRRAVAQAEVSPAEVRGEDSLKNLRRST